MPNLDKITVQEIVVETGEGSFDLKKGMPLRAVIIQAADLLDRACLNNVLLLKGSDGRYYRGEFLFELRPITVANAQKMAEGFAEGR